MKRAALRLQQEETRSYFSSPGSKIILLKYAQQHVLSGPVKDTIDDVAQHRPRHLRASHSR